MKFLLCLILVYCLNTTHSAAQDNSLFVGTWEDAASNNDASFQLVILNNNQFVRARFAQTNLLDSLAVDRDKIYAYEWVDNTIISYAKLPHPDPLVAEAMPPKYELMRIDKISPQKLEVSLSDKTFKKSELDSIVRVGAADTHIGERTISYHKFDLNSQRNKAILMGLWQAPKSNDSTKFQLYIQKNKLGFLKIKKEEFKKATTIKPNNGYYYTWINANTLYYYKEKATGFVKADNNPNKYALMRINQVNKKELDITISSRKFNKSGLNYVIESDNLDDFFVDNKHRFKRKKVISKLP